MLESSFNFKISRAVTKQVGNLEQRNKKLEKWNDALSSDIAALGEHRVQQERALKNAQKKERTTQKRLNLAHAKARGLKETVESERETKDELLDELKTLRAKLEKLEKRKDMLSISELLGPAENKSSTIPLQLVELGMSLLSKNISATACVGIFESFVALEHHVAGAPPKMRHVDQKRFCEWRFQMHDITHHLALKLLSQATRYHLIHDATTKDHWHMFGVSAIAEFPTDDGTGVEVARFPVDVRLLDNSTADAEADALERYLESR